MVCAHCGEGVYLDADGLEAHQRDRHIGRLLAERFALVRHVATGGVGTIYEAIQLPVGRRVAIKLLRAEVLADPNLPHSQVNDATIQAKARFRREARVISRLRHPNTVTLYDFGEGQGGELFIAMEFIEGPTLLQVMQDPTTRALSPERAIALTCQIARSLEEAHRHGVVHRDLKPANVMLIQTPEGAELVKVVDFGIARARHERDSAPITLTGSLSGTPNYMSPEQIRGVEVDHRADIYALGLMLYEMLTGLQAVGGEHAISVILKQIQDSPPPLAASMGAGPVIEGLQQVVDRAIAKDPAQRYDQVAAMRRDLESLSMRQELGAMWAGARKGAEETFDLLRSGADTLLDEIIETVQRQMLAWRQNPKAFSRRNARELVLWALHPEPDESALTAFMEARFRATGHVVKLHDLMGAFSCVFPALRSWAAEGGRGGLMAKERRSLEDHWSTLEAHFWHMARVICRCYEQFWATGAGSTPSGPTEPLPMPVKPRQTLDLVQLGQPVDDEQTALDVSQFADEATDIGVPAESGDFYENVLSSINTGLMVIDASTWIIRAVNPALTSLLDMDSADLVGRHVLDALRLIKGVEISELIRQVQSRGRLAPTKVSLRSAQGRLRAVMARGGLYRDAEGMIRGVMILADDITERELLVDSFRRYVGPEVVEDLLLTRQAVTLSGQSRKVTVAFIALTGEEGPGSHPDLEALGEPEQVVAWLNAYYEAVVAAVTAHRGMVDALIKETVMALFGTPFAHEDDPWSAVQAAQSMVQAIDRLNTEHPQWPRMHIGVGVATGPAVVGNVGTEERMNYTAVGTVVYRASQLRNQARPGEILTDEATARTISSMVSLTEREGAEGPIWSL
ncbi:MAG: protein kinase domain-containing protein [Bradymonadia bacterium]